MSRSIDELTQGADVEVPGPLETTQRVHVSDISDLARGDWAPFRFGGLERVGKTQILLMERMTQLLPGVGADGAVAPELLARLAELLDATVALRVDYVHVVPPSRLRQYLGTTAFCTVIAPLPHKPRGIFEVELDLAHRVIDLLFGGPGEVLGLRPLTDIEEGVMSYLVLEVLKALSPHLDPGLPKLRLESIAKQRDDALALFEEEAHVGVAQFKVVVGQASGYVRLLIPESVLRMAQGLAPGVERAQRQTRLQRPNLARLGGAKAWLRVDIGHTEITSEALRALAPKDVLVLDALTALPHKGEGGTAKLRVGLGRAGVLNADVYIENEKLFARVSGFELGDTRPPAQSPTAAEDAAAEALAEIGEESDDRADSDQPFAGTAVRREVDVEDSNEGAELLSDIPLQIAVELARVPVTAEQVLSLKVGQIFDLQRVPGEPVDLSVGGKVVARGELVEVDGHLGVRILTLLG
ncbi:MAG: type III secretion system cytoplasmic ring protein SctQ [Myxococcaceae bacterium]